MSLAQLCNVSIMKISLSIQPTGAMLNYEESLFYSNKGELKKYATIGEESKQTAAILGLFSNCVSLLGLLNKSYIGIIIVK
jgi:hypothetical protein